MLLASAAWGRPAAESAAETALLELAFELDQTLERFEEIAESRQPAA